jgi:hypothetical protein
MTIEVSGQELRWHFGPGFWRKRIALADIAASSAFAYHGGTHRHQVYPAVRIGTDDAERLMGALASR